MPSSWWLKHRSFHFELLWQVCTTLYTKYQSFQNLSLLRIQAGSQDQTPYYGHEQPLSSCVLYTVVQGNDLTTLVQSNILAGPCQPLHSRCIKVWQIIQKAIKDGVRVTPLSQSNTKLLAVSDKANISGIHQCKAENFSLNPQNF